MRAEVAGNSTKAATATVAASGPGARATGPDRQQSVRRRRVFYIPGYDPVPPRRYRELYRREGAEQARISGYELTVAGRPGADNFGWDVRATISGRAVETRFEVLVWSDIVRASMDRGILFTYGLMLRTVGVYIGSGAFLRLIGLRKGPVIAALYPIGMLLLQALVALALVVLGWWAGMGLLSPVLRAPLGEVAGLAAGLAAAIALLRWVRRIDGRTFIYYLMHDYAYSARELGADPPELRGRIAAFADRIAAALEDDVDEVLVVGHSSGAHIAVAALARLVRDGRAARPGANLSFLSLGQVIPMVSFLPRAGALRADLRLMSEQDLIPWIDVTAPGDGCTFALCDPVAVSGVARKGRQHWPLVISAAFTQTLSPERWQALRRRFFRLHFQYLCAFDRPGDYDYFQITAGPVTLGARYAGRAPSPSRIAAPRSLYRSVEP